MGITYVGVAIVGAMGNKVGPAMAQQMEYTEALKIMGFFLLAAWPLALFVLKDKPEAVGELPDGKASPAAVERDKPEERPRTAAGSEAKSFGFLMGKTPFWLLLVGSAASIGSIAAVNFLMKFVFEEQGLRRAGRARCDLEQGLDCGPALEYRGTAACGLLGRQATPQVGDAGGPMRSWRPRFRRYSWSLRNRRTWFTCSRSCLVSRWARTTC